MWVKGGAIVLSLLHTLSLLFVINLAFTNYCYELVFVHISNITLALVWLSAGLILIGRRGAGGRAAVLMRNHRRSQFTWSVGADSRTAHLYWKDIAPDEDWQVQDFRSDSSFLNIYLDEEANFLHIFDGISLSLDVLRRMNKCTVVSSNMESIWDRALDVKIHHGHPPQG